MDLDDEEDDLSQTESDIERKRRLRKLWKKIKRGAKKLWGRIKGKVKKFNIFGKIRSFTSCIRKEAGGRARKLLRDCNPF